MAGDIFSNFNCVPKPSWGHPAEVKGHLRRSVRGTLGMISIANVASFSGIKALSAHSDGCRALGCRIGGDSDPGRNGRRPGEPTPVWSE